jgi:hypothetical protein
LTLRCRSNPAREGIVANVNMGTSSGVNVVAGGTAGVSWRWSRYPQILPVVSAYPIESVGERSVYGGRFQIVDQWIEINQSDPPDSAIHMHIAVKNVGTKTGTFVPTLAFITK